MKNIMIVFPQTSPTKTVGQPTKNAGKAMKLVG
jgi:hypothetical protein